MHEFSLYGQVSKDDYRRTRMQLAGVTRMQPQEIIEIRLVFRAKPPQGINNLPSAGGSQGVLQQDVQRLKTMLNAALYFVYLVGRIAPDQSRQPSGSNTGIQPDRMLTAANTEWSLVFKDTPDAGKQVVSARMVYKIPLQDGNPINFLEQFGYEYVSRHMISSSEFYDQHTTLSLQQIMQLPEASSAIEAGDVSSLPPISKLQSFDQSGGHTLHIWVDVVDGNNPELKDRATKQLLALKDTLKQAVDLTPGDRLALDTKVPTAPRRL